MNLTPKQQALADKNQLLPFLLDKLNELEGKLATLETAVKAEPQVDKVVQQAASLAVAKAALLEKGEKGDTGPRGPEGPAGNDSTVPGPRGPDGKDGKDGRTPTKAEIEQLIEPMIPVAEAIDEIAIANSIESAIENKLPQFGVAFRNGLELLDGDERLDISAIKGIEGLEQAIKDVAAKGGGKITGWGAHPLMIKDGSTVVSKVARVINFGTNLTAILEADGTITVNALGGGVGYTVETPTGSVDSSNKTFTVSSAPVYIVVDGITYFENSGYSIVGTTITTIVAPTGFIRSFY